MQSIFRNDALETELWRHNHCVIKAGTRLHHIVIGITSHNVVSVVSGAERISVVGQVLMCVIGGLFT